MPEELAGQIPLVHRACEALGVPILTHERYEADDVIGTMTERAAAEGYRRGDRDRRQRLLPAGARTASASTTRATMGPGTTQPGVKEKFGVRPDQVVDVLALMGDTHRQRQRRARHRREGRARSDRDLRDARRAARARRRSAAEEVSRGARSPTPPKRARAANCCGFTRTCRSSSTSPLSATADRRGKPATSCSPSWVSARW